MKSIIIVDMQDSFLNENNNYLIECINNYLENNEFSNIFITKCINDDDSPFRKILKYNEGYSHKIVINQPTNAIIFNKNGYGLNQKQIDLIKEKGIKEIEICGTDIDACVLAIAFNLFDNGIKPIILSNLCDTSSKNKSLKNYSLEIIKRQFGNYK